MALAHLLFRFRNPLAALPLVYALFSTSWEWEADGAAWATGICLAIFGVLLRAWATCHCKYSTGQKKALAYTGPYRVIRNPLYVANILIILASVVVSDLAWFLPIAALWSFGVYAAVAAYEDRVMVAKFGQPYVEYRDSVPAWIPRLDALIGNHSPFLRAVVRQTPNLIWLVPFVFKELNMFGLGHSK